LSDRGIGKRRISGIVRYMDLFVGVGNLVLDGKSAVKKHFPNLTIAPEV
jgi:hypothetical protein